MFLLLLMFLTGNVFPPYGITPVDHFQMERYAGKWYEIARLDHSFERGLTSVSAEYSLLEDGKVRVINRGYSETAERWKQREGKAKFADGPDQGFLKVSFFGPFYGAYAIIELDKQNYSYALVCGQDRSYLWILARSPNLDDDIKKRLIEKAASLGFDTGALIYTKHDLREK
jgi:apolipoprotein D and lipocalin family protein